MINMYKLEFTILQQEILKYLFIKAGASFNIRGLARPLNVSQPAISKALPPLKEKDFIKMEQDKDSKRWSIELNRDSPEIIALKRVENLKMMYQSGLIAFLFNSFPGATIILFGSYSRGEDVWANATEIKNSDIDIAIIGAKEKRINLDKFDKCLERTINLNFYNSLNKIDKHLKNNLLNGIVLSGGIDL